MAPTLQKNELERGGGGATYFALLPAPPQYTVEEPELRETSPNGPLGKFDQIESVWLAIKLRQDFWGSACQLKNVTRFP